MMAESVTAYAVMEEVSTSQEEGAAAEKNIFGAFYRVETNSKLIILISLLPIVLVFLPLVTVSDLTVGGLPWLFVVGPVAFMTMPVLCLVLLYYSKGVK